MPSFLNSLWVKLTAAFLLVSLSAVALVAIWLGQTTTTAFQHFLAEEQMGQWTAVRDAVQADYAATGSWQNTPALLENGRIQGQGWLMVEDKAGQLVASVGSGGMGHGRSSATHATRLPLVVAGETIGYLLVPDGNMASMMAGHAEQFLVATRTALWLAVLAALLLSLLLGTAVASWLSRPVRQLTAAAHTLAAGQPPTPVQHTSHDELGQLAHSFNQMATALATAEQQRQQLLADTAHELRTPLTIIQGHLEGMLDGVFEPTAENLATVHEETLLLGRLIGDLRTLSLAETGQLPLELRPVHMGELAEQVVQAFRPLAESEGVMLTLHREDTPLVVADYGRLQQLLSNLLSNALRYVPHPDGQIGVWVAAVAEGVEVAVVDNGVGMTADMAARVFDRFWKADPARQNRHSGSGLGLAICRAIVELHHGRIGVESTPHHGTRFVFVLPVGQAG